MAGKSFGGSVKLTGESEYQKALRGISDNLRVLNSEMKAVTSEYDKSHSFGIFSSINAVDVFHTRCGAYALSGQSDLTRNFFFLLSTSLYTYQQADHHRYE